MKRRVLVVHPYLAPAGGGNAVAAWALQALRDDFAVSLATLAPVDLPAVNRSFGTGLAPGDFAACVAPARYRRLLALVRTPGALLDCQLAVRLAKNLDRRNRFDVLLSTHNEVDFGRRGIQYVNLPGAYLPDAHPPDRTRRRLSHRVPGLHRGFRALCHALSRSRRQGPLRNLFLANSAFIAAQIRRVYGVESVVLYPPVAGRFPAVPWAARRAGLVSISRIQPGKRWEDAVAVVEQLRERGHDLTLSLLGHREDAAYESRLRALAAARPWLTIRTDLPRGELLAELAAHRYGIHTMHGEHFGIAPAEILAAGCIPFVHDSGGPREIVGGEAALTFGGAAEAVDKIARVLDDDALQERLRGQLAARADQFSAATFCARLRAIVHEFQ